ncbi:putative peptide transport permease protein [Actinomadura sp. RB99]|jgi:peptide/nickel transport system permease protein|uniref:ABC transporter permease n=1 Tax=Actinomadura sp. RB99 TaxID=2691577 RepID=UPI0016882A42|nr:ABC transporter permease [Actinomadura sp. RB99]MBD2893709.1 putative peptide transport permease protein [Actinomadura sp. RB99]
MTTGLAARTAPERPAAAAPPPPAGPPSLPRRLARSRRAVAGLVLLAALFAVAFGAPLLSRWGWDDTDFTAFRQGPSARHWLGTTQSGRDVLALTLRGTRRSLVIGLSAAVLSTGLAGLVGAVAGFAGGRLDRILMWGTDLLLVLPSFLLVAVLAPALGGGALVPLLAAVLWMVTARAVRGMTASLREREYVLAARFLGAGPVRVIVRHVLPHLASLLVVDASVNVSVAVIAESGLSCLGLGVRPPDVSLGTLVAEGQGAATAYPWPFAAAAAMLVLIVLAVNLLGDGLRDVLDPEAGPRRGGR